jgi:hypothetical protein
VIIIRLVALLAAGGFGYAGYLQINDPDREIWIAAYAAAAAVSLLFALRKFVAIAKGAAALVAIGALGWAGYLAIDVFKQRDFTFTELLELKGRFARGEQPEIRRGNGERTVDVQIQRRIAFSMASLLLGMLAVPLGIRPLRSGRSAGALTAVAVMAVYWLVFSAGEVMAEDGNLPTWLGVWLANGVVVLLTVYLLRRTVRGDS